MKGILKKGLLLCMVCMLAFGMVANSSRLVRPFQN